MTPSSAMGMRNPEQETSGSSNLFNSISSNGMSQTSSMEQSQEPVAQNPAEQFLMQFKDAFSPVKTLLDDPNYGFAKKEGDLVKRALENFMEAVVTGISVQNNQEMGGESLGATPPNY
jgi:hypothetical protein